MPADLTGTPTSLGIGTYNTSIDAPSGLGFNEAMAQIDALIAARMLPPGSPVTDAALVWNGTAWVSASGGDGSGSHYLADDGTYKTVSTGGISVISDTTLAADTASFDISGISSTFKHLRIEAQLRTTEGVVTSSVLVRFNNDTTASYDWQRVYGNAASASAAETLGATSFAAGFVPGASAAANFAGAVVIHIPNYAGTLFNKTVISSVTAYEGSATGNVYAGQWGGGWRSSAAINRVTVLPGGGANFKAGSRLTLYGIS